MIALTTQTVNRYIDQGIAELVPGVLFIDEVRRNSSLWWATALSVTHNIAFCTLACG